VLVAVGEVVDALLPGLGRVGVVGADLGQAGLEHGAAGLALLEGGVDLVELLHVGLERVAFKGVPRRGATTGGGGRSRAGQQGHGGQA